MIQFLILVAPAVMLWFLFGLSWALCWLAGWVVFHCGVFFAGYVICEALADPDRERFAGLARLILARIARTRYRKGQR